MIGWDLLIDFLTLDCKPGHKNFISKSIIVVLIDNKKGVTGITNFDFSVDQPIQCLVFGYCTICEVGQHVCELESFPGGLG